MNRIENPLTNRMKGPTYAQRIKNPVKLGNRPVSDNKTVGAGFFFSFNEQTVDQSRKSIKRDAKKKNEPNERVSLCKVNRGNSVAVKKKINK